MAEEEKKAPEAQDKLGFVKDKLSSLLSSATELASTVGDKAKDGAEKVKDVLDEKYRDIQANKIFEKLGKCVYKLTLRNELQLPESCEKYIEALKDLYDENLPDDSCEMKSCDCQECKEEKEEEKHD